MSQIELFDEKENKPGHLGQASIYYKNAGSILNPTSGFMDTYDYSLNPYSGCAFGCTYCYAAFFARDNEQRENWGYWVNVKENALALLQKFRKKPLIDKTIYLSSVTDPYQPIEKKLELTRSILKELKTYHKPRLVIQTRSPLSTRDIDLFNQFEHIQVNMTITTDSERVRKIFEPLCPGNKMRLEAIKEIHNAGVQTCITITPLLPVEDPHSFAQSLLNTGIKKFIIQPFHKEKGKFTAGTRDEAMKLFKEFNWTDERYLEVENIIKNYIPDIGIGKEGFKPI
jgi:DNA repair photolyase